MAITTLDAKGLNCPLPVLRANKVARGLVAGDLLEVLATDSSAPADFEAFCETTGNHLVGCTQEDGVFTIVIRKAG